MPHQCVRCGDFYPTGCKELLTGCKCGSRFFFFVKDSAIEQAKEVTKNLSNQEKDLIERDIIDIVGSKMDDQPIVLDFESIKINKPGQYELDLVDLFKGKPLIYKLDEGKYIIDIVSTFEAQKNKNN
ncbi:MAG: Zn-ribbon containing protein [Nanoarchaeota archaeon]|nr:Zn-ribbon containing protein [Nanoarchaeota archaeon]